MEVVDKYGDLIAWFSDDQGDFNSFIDYEREFGISQSYRIHPTEHKSADLGPAKSCAKGQ